MCWLACCLVGSLECCSNKLYTCEADCNGHVGTQPVVAVCALCICDSPGQYWSSCSCSALFAGTFVASGHCCTLLFVADGGLSLVWAVGCMELKLCGCAASGVLCVRGWCVGLAAWCATQCVNIDVCLKHTFRIVYRCAAELHGRGVSLGCGVCDLMGWYCAVLCCAVQRGVPGSCAEPALQLARQKACGTGWRRTRGQPYGSASLRQPGVCLSCAFLGVLSSVLVQVQGFCSVRPSGILSDWHLDVVGTLMDFLHRCACM